MEDRYHLYPIPQLLKEPYQNNEQTIKIRCLIRNFIEILDDHRQNQ